MKKSHEKDNNANNIQEFVAKQVIQHLNDPIYIGYKTALDGDYLPNSYATISIVNNDLDIVKDWAFKMCCAAFERSFYQSCLRHNPDYLKFKNGERNVFLHNFDDINAITDYSNVNNGDDINFNGNDYEIQLVRKENGDCIIQENQCDNTNKWYEHRWEIHKHLP